MSTDEVSTKYTRIALRLASQANAAEKEAERLKAENASLREELEEARNEACVRCGFPTHDIISSAEQRAEAAEKERDQALAAAAVHLEEAGKLARWKAKAMLRLIELEPVHDEVAAAEQRAEAAEKRNAELQGALRAAADALNALQSTACRCLGEAYNPPEHLPTCPWWKVAAAEAHARRVLAALHDEERSAPGGENGK